jgi:hypothetical protein
MQSLSESRRGPPVDCADSDRPQFDGNDALNWPFRRPQAHPSGRRGARRAPRIASSLKRMVGRWAAVDFRQVISSRARRLGANAPPQADGAPAGVLHGNGPAVPEEATCRSPERACPADRLDVHFDVRIAQRLSRAALETLGDGSRLAASGGRSRPASVRSALARLSSGCVNSWSREHERRSAARWPTRRPRWGARARRRTLPQRRDGFCPVSQRWRIAASSTSSDQQRKQLTLRPTVLQHQYAISSPQNANTVLSTRGVVICTAWYGRDSASGTSFLCHFDHPWSANCVPRILEELRHASGEGHNFRSVFVGGKEWFWSRATRTKIREHVSSQTRLKI